MSNFFEQELRRLFGDGGVIEDPRFTGRICVGTLGGGPRVRAEFVTMGYANQYEALKLTVLNRTDGPVDALVLRFKDIWGRKAVSNPNFPGGMLPHVWENGDRFEWYVYRPTADDYQILRQTAGDYLDVFRERVPERTLAAPARKASGRASKPKGRDER